MASQKQKEEKVRDYGYLIDGAIYNPRTKREFKFRRRSKRYRAILDDVYNQILEQQPVNQGLTYAEWGDYVKDKIENKLTPFYITFKSRVVRGVEKKLFFKNIYHYLSWYELTTQEVVRSNSENVVKYYESELSDKDIFRFSDIVIEQVSGGCNRIRNGTYNPKKTIKTKWNTYHCSNPKSKYNNCGFACLEEILGIQLNYAKTRREYNLQPTQEVPIQVLTDLYNKHNTSSKFLVFIDKEYVWDLNLVSCDYIFHNQTARGGHYLVIESLTVNKKQTKKYKRSLLAFDFETRTVNKNTHYKRVGDDNFKYDISDTICSVHLETLKRQNRPVETKTFTLTTNEHINSSRQFLNYLIEEHRNNRHYTCIAHNGSRFDFILLQKMMTKDEKLHSNFQYRGLGIISMEFYGHIFRDTCCFMPFSLDNLCENFKIEQKKLTDFNLRGVKLTNKNLMFYKPELTLNEFLELEHKEPDYWKLYVNYCEYDCKSLMELWKKFKNSVETLIKRVGSYKKDGKVVDGDWLLKRCSLISKTTIGGLSKKIVEVINANDKFGYLKKYHKFFEDDEENDEKYEFICNFKRGGISHCNMSGKHEESISSVDITSQYPEAMRNMIVPAGRSWYVKKFNRKFYGYYHIKNLKWNTNEKFKPVCPNTDDVLNWVSEWSNNEEVYVDSEMLKYCIDKCGLVSFDVIKGLVSYNYVNGSVFFGKYIDTLFQAKAEQDAYKKSNDDRYNKALREVIKLFLNSLSGKLVEDPSKYYQLYYTSKPEEKKNTIGDVGFNKKSSENKNLWVGCGVMVYSHSKRLLFDYIKCLPEGSNSVVHIETDGIYFKTKDLEHFKKELSEYKGYFPCKIGNGLGNVKVEHKSTDGESYFLGKKFYYMNDPEEGEIMRIKGIRQTTIDKHGNTIQLVDKKLYEDVYNWKPKYNAEGKITNYIKRSFNTLVKNLFGDIGIYTMEMTRTIKPNMEYSVYK